MFKYSIYTSCFNIIKNDFNYWQTTIPKWLQFIEYGNRGEIVIAINESEDDTFNKLKTSFESNPEIKLIKTNFDYNDYAFDGKIKNIALQNTINDICIGLDLDEYPSSNKNSWDNLSLNFLNSNYEALLIPVIDLCKNINQYKSIGLKWYMHKRGLKRGIWSQAKLLNGKINIKKSDTCELLNQKDELCISAPISDASLSNIKDNNLPFVIHLGWLNWLDRKKQNQTWQPVWSNRAGEKVEDIIHQQEQFDEIQIFNHNLSI
jgi:hypothetical protein